ncbi:hypothetical protein FL857_05185 [Criibacterium bergeronii]|uniref:Uncharacterized protein n=1 Tax=Criibacterium bergeronii TaxID=1871336 RepID=A0A552V8Q6_9FIRM|nr:hypothetical protein [Criibacterium bergeronii]TRW26840.1 hypothetical protein FL857_05185 [Criibacterium bergeronii]
MQIIVLDDHKSPISRCILTIYPNETKGYIGLFESKNNVSGSYYKNLIVDRYDYILMKLDL